MYFESTQFAYLNALTTLKVQIDFRTHGFTDLTPILRNSLSLRVTTISPRYFAVLAIIAFGR